MGQGVKGVKGVSKFGTTMSGGQRNHHKVTKASPAKFCKCASCKCASCLTVAALNRLTSQPRTRRARSWEVQDIAVSRLRQRGQIAVLTDANREEILAKEASILKQIDPLQEKLNQLQSKTTSIQVELLPKMIMHDMIGSIITNQHLIENRTTNQEHL